MTGVGLERTRPKRLVPFTSASYHSAIRAVFLDVNSMDDGRRYHLLVFNIKDTILYIAMSTKYQEWDSIQATEVTGDLNQHLIPLGHPACMF